MSLTPISPITPIMPGDTALDGFPLNRGVYTTITPFTYRDGATMMEIIEQLRDYIKNKLIPFVNGAITEFDSAWADEIEKLSLVANLFDNNVQTAINDLNYGVSEIQNLILTLNSTLVSVSGSLALVNGSANNAQTYMNTAASYAGGAAGSANNAAASAANSSASAASAANSLSSTNQAISNVIATAMGQFQPILDGFSDALDMMLVRDSSVITLDQGFDTFGDFARFHSETITFSDSANFSEPFSTIPVVYATCVHVTNPAGTTPLFSGVMAWCAVSNVTVDGFDVTVFNLDQADNPIDTATINWVASNS